MVEATIDAEAEEEVIKVIRFITLVKMHIRNMEEVEVVLVIVIVGALASVVPTRMARERELALIL